MGSLAEIKIGVMCMSLVIGMVVEMLAHLKNMNSYQIYEKIEVFDRKRQVDGTERVVT